MSATGDSAMAVDQKTLLLSKRRLCRFLPAGGCVRTSPSKHALPTCQHWGAVLLYDTWMLCRSETNILTWRAPPIPVHSLPTLLGTGPVTRSVRAIEAVAGALFYSHVTVCTPLPCAGSAVLGPQAAPYTLQPTTLHEGFHTITATDHLPTQSPLRGDAAACQVVGHALRAGPSA